MRPFGTMKAADGAYHIAPSYSGTKEPRLKKQSQSYIDICLNCTKEKCNGCESKFENKYRRKSNE